MSNKNQLAASEADEKIKLKTLEPKPMSGADFITSLGFIIFGTAMFITAYDMHMINIARNVLVRRVHLSSPGLFPMIIGAIFFLFGVFMLYRSIRRGGLIDAKRIISFNNIASGITSPITKKLCVVFLLILGYVSLMGRIPFIYLSMGYLFLTFLYLYLKEEKWFWVLVITLTFPIAINALFTNFFRIPMP